MRNRRTTSLLWVGIAALALVTLARAQSGIASGVSSARDYASPLFEVLAAYQASDTDSAALHSRSHSAGTVQNSVGQPLVADLLPVLFVGLLLLLTVLRTGSRNSLGRAPSAPARPFLFQRPPPHIL